MKNLNFLSNLCGLGRASQSSDVGYDSRLTVGSPSGLESSKVLKFVSVLVLILTIGSGNVWGAEGDTHDFSQTLSQVLNNGVAIADVTVAEQTYTVKEVKVTVNYNKSRPGATVSVKVGGVTFGSAQTINSNTTTTFTFTGASAVKGQVVVSSTNNCTSSSGNGTFKITNVRLVEGASAGCSNSVALSKGTATNGTVNTISSASVATCSATASDRRVTVTITPAACYDAPTNLTWTRTSGTVSASKQSGPTDNGDGTYRYVYQFEQNNNGAGTFGVTCTAKAAGKTVNFNAGPGSCGTSSLTETCDGSGVTLPAVTATGVCKGWTTFAGWATAAVSDSTTTSGVTLYAAGSKFVPASNGQTLYAVYSKSKGGGGSASWVLSSSAPAVGDSIIVAYYTGSAYKYMKNSGADNGDLTVAAGVATPVANGKFKLVSGNSYGVSLNSGSNYLHLNSSAINVTTARTNGDLNISAGSSTNSFIIKRHSGATTYDRVLKWTGSNWTSTATMGDACEVYFFKRTTSTTYYCSDPNCCSDPGLAYATGSVTKTYGDDAFTNPLTNSHSVGVTYALSSVSPAGCVSINASTGQVTINAAGSATVTASFAGNATYCADEASYTLTVNKADISPSLSYESGTLVIGNNSSSPTVGGNSGGGTVTYAVTTANPAGCVTVNASGVVTAVAEGTATITATIGATTNYNGGSATANFTVTCGAPSSVDISGNYQFYPGETISLTATPTGGAGTPVTYQWKKDGVNIVGATSATYTKDDATVSDAGSYTCTVQYGSNCATTSDAFKLKCMQFYLKTSGGADISNHALTKVDATHATLSLSLTGGTTYKFRVTDGCGDWYGNTGEMTSSNCTNWAMDADADCRVTTSSKSATYVFNFDFSGGLLGSEMKVTVVYPSSNQASGKVIYWDNEVNKWNGSKLWYRIGKSTHNSNTQLSKVAGTANFYSVTTSQYDGFEYWHIANNVGQGTGNIFWTKDNSGSGLEITNAMGFEGAPVTDATVTVTPTTTHSTGGSSDNNNCEFYTYSITSGVKSYTVTSSATNCTVAMEKYNNDAGSSTTALASGGTVMPTQYVKVTVTPNTGYQFSSVVVTNGTTVTAAAAGTPGVYYITGNATVTATCTAKTCTVNFDKNSGSGGDASTTATYGLALPTVSVPSRTGYTFDGYWDAETNNNGSGTQYYSANGICARNWDKDVTATQTLYAKWTAKEYTITLDREGAASGATSVTATYDAGTLAGWSAPSKTGYTFGGYWSGDNGTGTLVISTSGVLQNSVTISAVNWTDASGHWIKDGGVTVYAKWTAEQYTITYKDQGNVAYSGSNGGSLPTTHTYGAATALVDGVKSGYRFDGWFDNSSCTGAAVTSIGATAKTADFTLYAKWTQVYTVTWYVNGDEWTSGTTSGNTEVVSGQRVSALPTAPTSSDCDDSKKFVGWKAAEIDGTSAGNPGGIFTTQAGSPTISANTNFYAVFADVTGGDVIELTFPDDNSENNGLTSNQYTSTWTAMSGTTSFSISNFNNNNWAGSWTNIRCGRKSTASTATITTDAVIGFRVDSIYLTMDAITASGVDTMKLFIDDNSSFSSPAVMGIKKQATTHVLKIASPAKDQYYKFEFTCNNSYSSGSGYVRISKIAYKQQKDTANYVTTCASCDDDATFTNTTPAVSAIGCTGATLTATGGLATLGAAGCNVSDYGFVIGTADDPAIGGVGVTKYQVGTTNPTTGEDFSYDATGLTKGTHYYIRAYAINRHGTAYSSSTNFWTNNVSSIAITTAPTKTNYIVGETFDATGMVVTATMASDATEDVTSDVTYSTDPLTSGTNKDFAINYTLCETDKSVNQKINVYTLSVSEGTNPSYGSYTVDGAVITVSLEAQKTFSFATTNCSTRDNGDGTYTVINVTGNATVVINYRNAVQVKVYYKVDGTTITSLTQDVYESSQTTLPTASALSSAMAAQGMALPDELYPNFIGWSETEFGAQTADPTIVEGTPVINAEKNYYAVYSNVNKIRIDESDITSTSYPGSEQTLTKSSKDFKYHYVCKNSTYYLQFKKNSTQFGYIYNNTAIGNITKIEVGASGDNDFVPVYAGSAANTISGSKLTDEDISEYKYVYLFPSNTQYFIIKGDNSYTYKVNYIDIFYASSTVYYMTQFCTRYAVTGASTGGTAVIVNGNTGGTLTSSHNELCEGKNLTLSATVNTQYSFGEWKIVKTGSDPEVDLTAGLLGANKTSLTPPAFAMPGYGITVSATISEKTATAWSWTYNSAAIPDPMILYVGEVKQLDVTYTPDASQLVSAQKNYSVDKESSVAQAGKTSDYYKMRGAAGVTEETNTAVTFSLNSLSQVVNVTVRPLPSATFEDNVHNAISTTVTATVSDGVVSLTKKTPTHADISPAPASGNACEKQHLHLIGWIDGDWEPFINYMNGGSRPSDSDITTATGYFFLPNADIDLSQKGGKTYYAVWGKADE